MRILLYASAIICLLLIGFQAAIIASVWFGPRENHIQLMGIPMVAPFVFLSAAATCALAHRIGSDENRDPSAQGERSPKRVSAQTFQRFAVGVMVVQALMFLAG
jgi:hypothetical protein